MARLYLSIPGLGYQVELTHKADIIPSVGDRISVEAKYLGRFSRRLLEQTPAYHCFERNEKTEHVSMAEYLTECVITVLGKTWSYENGISSCTLEVEFEY